MQKKLDPYLPSNTKINIKWIKNVRENLHDLDLGDDFLAMTPKAQAVKEKEKLNFSKIKNVCASEGTTDRVKR